MDFLVKGRVLWFQSLFREFTLTYKIRIRLLSRVYHFSLLICYPYSFNIYLIMCKEYMIKIFKTKNIKNQEIFYLKWRTEWNCSWKRALHFNKRAPFFDKKPLGLSGQVEVKSAKVVENSKLFLTLLVQTKKKNFPKAFLTKHPIPKCFIFLK